MYLEIIPEIKDIKLKDEIIDLRNFYIEDKSKVAIANELLEELFSELGENNKQKNVYPILFLEDNNFNEEAYKIEIDREKINIKASSEKGFFYGIVTIIQLGRLNKGKLNCCSIYDEPEMKLRAVSDDISRGQISTKENFKSIIKRLSLLKINAYFPYIEDVFKFKSEPEIGKFSDAMSGEEWKEICEYAKKYYVSVRPVFNTLGHWEKMGCLKRYNNMMLPISDNSDFDFVNVLNPEHPEVRPMLSKLLDELVDTFGKGLMHMGGDEPTHLTELYGKEKSGDIYIKHYKWLASELKKRGCTMAMYTDMFSPVWGDYSIGLDRIKELPKDTRFVFWGYAPESDYSNVDKLCKMGLNIYISPGTWSWCRLATDVRRCFGNTKNLIQSAKNQSKGMIMSCWCDNGADNLRELNWPGFAVASMFAWNNNSNIDYDKFMNIFHKQFYGFEEYDNKQVDNLYHYDRLLDLEKDAHAARFEFWKDARKPVDKNMKSKANEFLKELNKVKEYLESLEPKYNKNSYDALVFSLERQIFLAHKLLVLKSERFETREEAKEYIDKIKDLIIEISNIKEKHEKLWFRTNRQSEWNFLEAMYIELEESLKSLQRYCNNYMRFKNDKFIL